MNHSWFARGVLGAIAVVALAPGAARAQTYMLNLPAVSTHATNDYHAVLTQTGLTWTVTVSAGDLNGNNLPNHDNDIVTVDLYHNGEELIASSASGGTTSSTLVAGKREFLGTTWDAAFGAPPTVSYTVPNGHMDSATNSPWLSDKAGVNANQFNGTFTLAAGQSPVNEIAVFVQDGGQWSSDTPISAIPEPATAALLLPGALPMLMLWRRRRACS